jgi:GDP-4-dehydro-6-deoxy-D-mannose reductase
MRVLITGATGFVGQHLTRIFSRKQEVFGTFWRRDFAVSPPGIKLLQCDLRQAGEVRGLVRDVRPEHVYHLAALSSVRGSFNHAKAFYDANFLGTLNLLEAVRISGLSARVLLVGSVHCYGRVRSSRLPIVETEPLNPDSPYGVSKAAADMLGAQFFQNYGAHVVRARSFNHTGPGQSPEFVCSDFARQFAAIGLGLAQPSIRVGDVTMRRDFSDVRDVVRAYILLLQKGKVGQAYNVASGRAVSLREVLVILHSLCPRDVKIEVEQQRLRRGEADVLYGSNRKLKRTTGWRPKYDLSTTLRDLYAYWKETLRKGNDRDSKSSSE